MSMEKHLSALGENAREVVAEAANAIRSRFNGDVRVIGEHLAAVKAVLPHGAFGPWLARELGITPRTAQNYMQAATFLAEKRNAVSHLPPAILYKLAAPTALPVLVDKVVQATEHGTAIDIAALKKALVLQRDVLRHRKEAAQWLSDNPPRRSGRDERKNMAATYTRSANNAEAELAALPIVKGAPT
jgi:hypothetical protein